MYSHFVVQRVKKNRSNRYCQLKFQNSYNKHGKTNYFKVQVYWKVSVAYLNDGLRCSSEIFNQKYVSVHQS